MAIDIFASAGVFAPRAEHDAMRAVFAALLAAVDATDGDEIASGIGTMLHVVPAEHAMVGGRVAACVRIDVIVPGIALASFRRRRRFIRDTTAAVVAHARDATIEERVTIRILHAVDGGWGSGGVALTNDVLDEGPEED
jgi:hypothetical protein